MTTTTESNATTQVCTKCKHALHLNEFKIKANGDTCVKCKRCNEMHKLTMRKHKESRRCPCGKYANKCNCKTCSDPIKVTAKVMVHSAKKADTKYDRFDKPNHVDKEFCIELLNAHKRCIYTDCNKKLQVMERKHDMATLERKDNAVGHTKDNCTVCCYSCNVKKRDYFTSPTRSQCSWHEIVDLDYGSDMED